MTKWTRTVRLALALTLGHATLGAAPAWAQQEGSLLQREDDDEERLRRWMAVRASRSPDVGWVAGVAIPFGVAAVAGGVTFAAMQGEWGLDLTLPSVALIGLGAFDIALGIFSALAPNLPREDYRAIPDRQLTEREIGRLEGTLRYEARMGELGRNLSMWMGAGLGLGGLAAIPVVALAPPVAIEDQSISWGVAGGFALSGIIFFISSFFETPPEADWREYRRGLMPHEPPAISFVPTGNGFALTF